MANAASNDDNFAFTSLGCLFMDRCADKVIAMLLKVLFRRRTRPEVFLRNSCLRAALVCPEIQSGKKQKKEEGTFSFLLFLFHLRSESFFVRAFKVTVETVNAIMANPTETRAALLNSGTFGVEVDPVEAEVLGAVVGLEEEDVVDVSWNTPSPRVRPSANISPLPES
jgi:hypothetical protein